MFKEAQDQTNTNPAVGVAKNFSSSRMILSREDIDLSIDITSELANVKVSIPLTELMKTPSQREKVKKFLGR